MHITCLIIHMFAYLTLAALPFADSLPKESSCVVYGVIAFVFAIEIIQHLLKNGRGE